MKVVGTLLSSLTMMMCLFLMAGTAPVVAQSDSPVLAVDAELVLAADGSGSISDEELAVQREGYAAAITDPRVLGVIRRGGIGRLAIAYVEWGGAHSQEVIADWHVIDDAASAAAFAKVLLETPRKAFGWNSISNAIWKAAEMLDGNRFEGLQRVIDVSGDSGQFGGRPLADVRAHVVARGITINGLALNHRGGGLSGPGGKPLEKHYREDVIGGPGAFVMTVEEPEEFQRVILNKLILEIAAPDRFPSTTDVALETR